MTFNPMEFGTRLSMVRKANGLTQEQMAERLNISWEYMSKIERGQRTPSPAFIVSVACTFNVSTDYLLMGSEMHPADNRTRLLSVISQLTDIANNL